MYIHIVPNILKKVTLKLLGMLALMTFTKGDEPHIWRGVNQPTNRDNYIDSGEKRKFYPKDLIRRANTPD